MRAATALLVVWAAETFHAVRRRRWVQLLALVVALAAYGWCAAWLLNGGRT
jgi:hypothetical protein